MVDADVAKVYAVSTKQINQAAKRNPERFPDDFRFQLTEEETDQINIIFFDKNLNSRSEPMTQGWGGRRYLPYAYSREGCNMFLTILNTPRAVERSVQIIRAFSAIERKLQAGGRIPDPEINTVHARVSRLEKTIEQIYRYRAPNTAFPISTRGSAPSPQPSKWRISRFKVARLGLEEEVRIMVEAQLSYDQMAGVIESQHGRIVSASALHRYVQSIMNNGVEPTKKSVAAKHLVEFMRDNKDATFAEIGEQLGVSRQRAHQIYQEDKKHPEPTARIKYLLSLKKEKIKAFVDRIGLNYQIVCGVINQKSKNRAVRAAIADGLGVEYRDLWPD